MLLAHTEVRPRLKFICPSQLPDRDAVDDDLA